MAAEFVAKQVYTTDHTSTRSFILSHIRRHWWLSISLMLGAFSNAALAGVVPYAFGQVFDELNRFVEGTINSDAAMAFTVQMILVVVGSQLLRAILQLLRNFSSETYGQRIERDVRDELYASLLGKSMSFHDMQPVGEIMARVTNDVREMNMMMNPGVNLLVGATWFLIVPILASPLIHPALLLTPLTFVLIHFAVQYRFLKQLNPIAERVRSNFGQMNSRLAEALDGLQVIKGAAQERQETEYFNRLADNVRDEFIHQGRVEARYLSNFLFPLSLVIGLLHGVILYRAGAIDVGDIVAYEGLLGLFGFPVFSSLNALSRVSLGVASADRILSIIKTETDLDRNDEGYDAGMRGQVQFDSVSFGYTPEKMVLHNLNFSIEPGQTVAIVGQTGSGKSTITKLINRMYDASKGRVLVDDVDVTDWNLESLRSQISIIEQDIFLFSRTLAENIAFGHADATPEMIIDAAKKAQAHEFIMTFPEGYKTVIGQRGVTLSGGQRQRIAIARAFLTDPPILILDDSTSAIDSATEDKIQRAIYAASQDRTMILITHRLSQIRWADHIIVLRNGEIVAQGKHDDLLRNSPDYRRIFARYESREKRRSTQELQALMSSGGGEGQG
jgi:ATP-binding cassette subfamily B protein